MKNFIFLTLILSCFSVLSFANDSADFEDSLKKTQELLRDHTQRDRAVSETENAKKADSQVKKLAPDAKTQDEYYDLAADILNNFKDAKDEDAMKKNISDAQRDPTSFFKNLTPEQKAKIKALSEKLNPGANQNP